MLSDRSIRKAIADGSITLHPAPTQDAIQPASVDVHLGETLIWFTEAVEEIDPAKHQPELTATKRIPEQGFSLMPGEFVLGTTVEQVSIGPDYSGEVTGKSSLGRLGLLVHSTAGFLDPGFDGRVTLEIKNINSKPIRLRVGMRIGQFKFFRLDTTCQRPYGSPGLNSRYQGQSDTTVSRSWM